MKYILNLIEKVYTKNKPVFFKRYPGRTLHHIQRRRKNCIERCCIRMWSPEGVNHEANYEHVNTLRDEKKAEFLVIQENYLRGFGCKKYLFADCWDCQMPKLSCLDTSSDQKGSGHFAPAPKEVFEEPGVNICDICSNELDENGICQNCIECREVI